MRHGFCGELDSYAVKQKKCRFLAQLFFLKDEKQAKKGVFGHKRPWPMKLFLVFFLEISLTFWGNPPFSVCFQPQMDSIQISAENIFLSGWSEVQRQITDNKGDADKAISVRYKAGTWGFEGH